MSGNNEYSELINEIRGLRQDINDVIGETQDRNYKATGSFRNTNRYFRGGRGKTFSDIFGAKEDHEDYKEILSFLNELKSKYSDLSLISDEDNQRLKEYGLSVEELGENFEYLDDVVDDFEEKKRETNLGNRLVAYNNSIKNIISSLKNMDSSLYGLVEPWAKADKAASQYAKTVAMTKAGMDALRSSSIDNVVNSRIGIRYNMSTDELLKAQSDYVKGVGRSLRIDNTQQESLAAMHAVMGGRENELAAAFENFGVSLNGVADHAGKMFADASKSGLSFEKYSDNVAKNIKIAQNYTFKNGLKGLESMAKKATALKLDMGQVASFAEKVSTIEGSIDVASKLQVLGGQFASIADPLGMLSEGLMDMEGLTDRIIHMIGGLGNFDKAKGEVTVSAFNKQRIKAAAQAMGMDYSQLMESVNTSAKREEITRQIGASANAKGLSEDMKELIKNSATFNEEGKAGVSINGEFKTLDQITNNDYKDLVKETQDQAADIKDIARNLRSLVDSREGFRKQKEAVQAQMTGWLGNSMKSITNNIGEITWILRGMVIGKMISTAGDMLSSGLDIIDMFRSRRGRGIGRFANRIGKGSRIGKMFRGGKAAYLRASRRASQGAGNMIGRFGNKIGTSGFGNIGKGFLYEKVGNVALSANNGMFNIGTNMAGRGGLVGKAGTFLAEQAVKNESKMVAGVAAKATGKEIAKNAGKQLIKGGLKGGIAGLGLGLAGAGVDMWRDNLVAKGKIKDGGFAQGAMTVGASALKGAGIGAMFGPWGAAIGGAIGAVVGGIKAIGHSIKVKRQKVVDAQLNKLGIQRQGDYNAIQLRKIDNALQTGKLSNRMRKKLLERGDADIVQAIEKKKEEKAEKKRKDRLELISAITGGGKKNIAKGAFNVQTAYFGGVAFGGVNTNIERKGQYDENENKAIDEAIRSGKISAELKQKLEENQDTEILKAIEDNAKRPPVDLSKLQIEKNKFGVANFEIGVANFKTLGKQSLAERILGLTGIRGVPINGESPELKKMRDNNIVKLEKEQEKQQKTQTTEQPNSITNGKIDLNISGTIKLVGENGQGVDITDKLINNPVFITELTKLITAKQSEIKTGHNRNYQ